MSAAYHWFVEAAVCSWSQIPGQTYCWELLTLGGVWWNQPSEWALKRQHLTAAAYSMSKFERHRVRQNLRTFYFILNWVRDDYNQSQNRKWGNTWLLPESLELLSLLIFSSNTVLGTTQNFGFFSFLVIILNMTNRGWLRNREKDSNKHPISVLISFHYIQI